MASISQNPPAAVGSSIGMISQSLDDASGDTEPATDDDDTYEKIGSRKRGIKKLPGGGIR
jgi:hypothetical protein